MYGFAEDQVEVRGHVELRTTPHPAPLITRYLVVNAPSAYNILLGRPSLNRIGAVASTKHMKMKLPSLERVIITIKFDQKATKKWYEKYAQSPASLKREKGSPVQGWPGRGDLSLQERCWKGRSGEISLSLANL